MAQNPVQAQVILRPMTFSDLDEVVALDCASFPTPWPKEAFEYELRHQGQSLCWVAEWLGDDRKAIIVGTIVIWLMGVKAHIGTLAVRPGYRRLGIGRHLLLFGLRLCTEKGVQFVTLEVRKSNQAAQQLYREQGFETSGIKENYYKDSHEDAIVMTLALLN